MRKKIINNTNFSNRRKYVTYEESTAHRGGKNKKVHIYFVFRF